MEENAVAYDLKCVSEVGKHKCEPTRGGLEAFDSQSLTLGNTKFC